MDKHCRICHNISCSNHGKNVSFLGDGWKCNYIPVPTNADKIRAMSDEELAKYLYQMQKNILRYVATVIGYSEEFDFADEAPDLLEWLQQPVEGE